MQQVLTSGYLTVCCDRYIPAVKEKPDFQAKAIIQKIRNS